MTTLDFDPDRVRTLGTGFDTAAYDVLGVNFDGNTELLSTDMPGSLVAAMCGTSAGLVRDALAAVQRNFLAVSSSTLHAVGEFTGKDEAIATDITRIEQGVR
ncbi:hypothetical protein ACFC06_17670 [Nocardia sp. NPDC056064]|uniref:hypothetical protein n=1 Tax=Nocardia sp. NPDC056064 TaxID=3345701 RepID=UPI0035D6335E